VALAWTLERYPHVETVGFVYGKRHAAEMEARERVLSGLRLAFEVWDERLGDDHKLDIAELGRISETALTRDAEISMTAEGLPTTFVPGRNLLFFTYAAAVAYRRGIGTLVGGMCETDYSGYPDCRNETLQALGKAISLGMARDMRIETPLMWIDKAATWELAHAIGGAPLVALIEEETHTCYLGDRSKRHPWGYGCGTCPACQLRAKGWEKWRRANA